MRHAHQLVIAVAAAATWACPLPLQAEVLVPVVVLTPLAPGYQATGATQTPVAWTFAGDADVWQIDLSAFAGPVQVSIHVADAFPALPDDYDLLWDGALVGNTQTAENDLVFVVNAGSALHTLTVAYANAHTGIEPSDGGSYYALELGAAPAGGGDPWTDLGAGLAGTNGTPALAGTGTLAAGSAGSLALTSAKPVALALLFVSFTSAATPFKGGALVPVPPVLTIAQNTAFGSVTLPWAAWPAGIPSLTTIYFQYAVQDPAAVQGVALSNALAALTP